MAIRINPLKIESSSASIEAASITNTRLGECPICIQEGSKNSKMQVFSANGHKVYTCLEHRVCLPVED